MTKAKNIFSLMVMLMISGCTQVGLFTANMPAHFSEVKRHDNIFFDAEHMLSLDIYTPKNVQKNTDVIVFFYGGRWTDGRKEDYQFVGTALAEQGFVVIIPDYRKYPDVKFPGFVEDSARAVAWVSDNIAAYNGNPERINLSGHSSGAHLAALVATNPVYLAAFGKNRDKVVHSFVGLAGPYDFTPEEDDLKDMFGPPENYPLMRPTTFVDEQAPPMLLLHGADDKIVGRFNYEHLEEKMKENRRCAVTKLYAKIDHVWIVGSLSWLGRSKAPVLQDMVGFFKKPECSKK